MEHHHVLMPWRKISLEVTSCGQWIPWLHQQVVWGAENPRTHYQSGSAYSCDITFTFKRPFTRLQRLDSNEDLYRWNSTNCVLICAPGCWVERIAASPESQALWLWSPEIRRNEPKVVLDGVHKCHATKIWTAQWHMQLEINYTYSNSHCYGILFPSGKHTKLRKKTKIKQHLSMEKHKVSNHSVVMLSREDVDSWNSKNIFQNHLLNSPPVLSCNLAFGKSLPGMWHLDTPWPPPPAS